jgi:DNA-binding transcriptional ArsR family regulator
MPAGAIGEAVGTSSSNLSFHLKELEHAGLVQSRRVSRSIIYSASMTGLGELLRFLTEDCCQGHPEVCDPAFANLSPCCPEPANV